MPSWSPTASAARRSCCSTKSPRISIPAAAPRLFERLAGRGQVWMTGTEPGLFDAVPGDATRYRVADGAIHSDPA
jgi:hypothetical protein